jgi:hypothetical protein
MEGIKEKRLSNGQLMLLFLLLTSVLVLPGADIYTHIHQSWIYNQMFEHGKIIAKDPSLLNGQQMVYDRSVPAYAFSGFAWFFFQKSVIKVLEVVLFAGIIFVSLKLFRDWNMLFFWFALLLVKVLLLDEYPYLFSVFFFYFGIYLIRKWKNKFWGDLSILLAGLNHPYVAATNIVTVFSKRKILVVGSVVVLLLQILLVKLVFFNSLIKFDYFNIFDFGLRSAVLLLPFFSTLLPGQISRIFTLQNAFIVAAVGLLAYYPVAAMVFSGGIGNTLNCYYAKSYSEIPPLAGSVRIVDDCRDWTYELPRQGFVLSESQEFQGQYYHTKWTVSKYIDYLAASNTSHVVFCKNCFIISEDLQKSRELDILKNNFGMYEETDNYLIFNTTGAKERQINESKSHKPNQAVAFIQGLINKSEKLVNS